MIRQAFLMVLIAGVVGCATMDKMKTLKRFQETELGYRSLIMRSDFGSAAGYIEPAWMKNHPRILEILKNYKITDCKVEKATLSGDRTRIQQKVVIYYFRTDRMVLKTMVNVQDWQYDRDKGRWFLMNGLPPFESPKRMTN